MIYGHIEETDQWKFLAANPAWRHAFDWLRNLPAEPEQGRYPLMGDDMYGLIMGYETLEPHEVMFESHRQYIDLQFTIRGGEKIGWCRATALTPDGEFDTAKDFQLYRPAEPITRVQMDPGNFAVFFPSDAHQPKLADGIHTDVFKAVVKIARHLVA